MDNIEKTQRLSYGNGRYSMSGSTFIGTRDYQQDRMLLYEDGRIIAAAVCDGMGGMDSGEKASQLAVDMFMDALKKFDGTESVKDFLYRETTKANYAIASMKDEYGRTLKSGTTISMVMIENNIIHVMSSGDSRVYVIRDESIKQLTKDHNYGLRLEEQLKLGIINKQRYEAEKERAAEALISFLGIGEPVIVDIAGPYTLMNNDIILVCSDGLYKGLSNTEIEQFTNKYADKISELPDRLIAAARANVSRMDNTTVVAIKYNVE